MTDNILKFDKSKLLKPKRGRSTAEVLQSEHFYRLAALQAKIAFWRWSFVTERMTHWSDEYDKIDALGADEQHNDEDMLRSIHDDDRDRVRVVYDKSYDDVCDYSVDYRIVDADGEVRRLHEIGEVEYNEEGEPLAFVGSLQDITKRKNLEQKLLELSRIDDLTGLVNRREFNRLLEQALERIARTSSKLALLYIDIDGFKKVNDDHGHDAGDEVLKLVSSRIKNHLRKSDVAARVGGDEFAIILEGEVTTAHTIVVAEKMLATLSDPFRLSNKQKHMLSGSIGIVLSSDDEVDMQHLISIADKAMYDAKSLGKNRYILADG